MMDWRYHLLKKTGYCGLAKDTSGKTLEFIGASGIGKTSLFNRSIVRLKSRWLFAYHLEFLKRKAPPCENDKVLMKILEDRIDKIKNSDLFCSWHSLLDLKLSVKVMHETMLVVHSAYPKGIAFDEGLFRHFAEEILLLGDDFPAQLWQNRAFVYLRARTPETVVARYKVRGGSSAVVERQRDSTDEQVYMNTVRDQEQFQSIIDRAPAFGCPVLVIDAEDPMQELVGKVLDFEKSLSKKFTGRAEMSSLSQTFSRD